MRDATAVAGVLALAGWAATAAAPAYSGDRQQRFVIEHVTDLRTLKSAWSVLNDGAPLPGAYRAAATWVRGKLPFSERPRWIAAAPADAVFTAAPGVQRLSEVRNGTERTQTEHELTAYAADVAGPDARALVRTGEDPAREMAAIAREENVDVIVVGSVGMSGRKEFLLENIPNRISHLAPCTVVIVQTQSER